MTFDLVRDSWFLTGPTASGKTAVGVELALRLGAEIVSLDSMALYRGMDIGTAKPSLSQRDAARHHLLDLADPRREFSLAEYVDQAHHVAGEIASRGRAVLFVGGTPLYLNALLRGMFHGPPADEAFRRDKEAEAREHGEGHLHGQLAEVDPASAAKLHANDIRRLIRALEVYEKTGQPISALQQQFDRAVPQDQCRVFLLDWPREALYERINRRVEGMFAEGFVEEVRELLAGGPLGRTAAQAVGYREVIEHLKRRRDLAETIDLVKTRTRQFAKRQLTWFRGLSECRPVAMSEASATTAVVDAILQLGRDTPSSP